MGWVVQINPTSPAFHLSRELVEILDPFLDDYQMRYCYIDPERAEEALNALRGVSSRFTEEQRVIDQIVALLEDESDVELLFGN
jgi:hypothetical protein